MKRIRAVTFDVGGTLIQPWPSVGHIYAQFAERHGYGQISPEKLNANFAKEWKRKRGFRHSREQWRLLVNQTFAGLTPDAPRARCFDDLYAFFATAQAWQVFDDVRLTLEDLRARGFNLGIISNWDERLRPLLAELGLAEYFQAVAISIEVGCTKPQPRIFRACLDKLGMAAECVVHIGDSANEDVGGAEAAGMAALLLDRARPESEKSVITSLRMISRLLEKRIH